MVPLVSRERHRYLIRPDESGRAETAKQFFVSPLYPVDGYYRMSVPEPDQRLAISVTLHRPGDRPFTAALRGRRRPATVPAVLATVRLRAWDGSAADRRRALRS